MCGGLTVCSWQGWGGRAAPFLTLGSSGLLPGLWRRGKAGQALVAVCFFKVSFSLQRGDYSWIRQGNCGHERSSQMHYLLSYGRESQSVFPSLAISSSQIFVSSSISWFFCCSALSRDSTFICSFRSPAWRAALSAFALVRT